jgi:hippurate hydrolase
MTADGIGIEAPDAHPDIAAWRRAIHARPELGFGEHATAAFVAERLRVFGADEVHEGIAGTGVVAILRAGTSTRSIGLRADLDALPIAEGPSVEERPHRSQAPGVMHACGHDGHSAMLLGGAELLARTRRFDGTIVLIFQPAEEILDFERSDGNGRGGAVAMIEAGLLERFPMDAMFGMHNRPQLAAGEIRTNAGPVYAAVDRFEIRIEGRGGHAARPHLCIDPIPVAARLIDALQGIAARIVDPFQPVVVSICQLAAGTAFNVVPSQVAMTGTVRSFDAGVRAQVETEMRRICEGVGAAHRCTITLDYQQGHPSVVNDPACVALALEAATTVVGPDRVGPVTVQMGGEDFAHFAARIPSAFVLIGNGLDGDHGCNLHSERYDFNDAILPIGAAYWRALAERALPVAGRADVVPACA